VSIITFGGLAGEAKQGATLANESRTIAIGLAIFILLPKGGLLKCAIVCARMFISIFFGTIVNALLQKKKQIKERKSDTTAILIDRMYGHCTARKLGISAALPE
jgi:hypothetical protein